MMRILSDGRVWGASPDVRLLAHSKVLESGCRVWTGAVDSSGYGRTRVAGRMWSTHRLSYTLFVGPIPDGLTIDHLCFNTRCMEPSHLRLLTHSENASNKRAALATHCHRGHEYGEGDVQRRTDGRMRRCCKTCYNEMRRLRRIEAVTS